MMQGDLLTAITPFKPFRVIMTSGETFDVWHREASIIAGNYITIGLLPTQGGQTYERSVILDIFHVIGIEPLPRPVPTKGNGQAS
jgi:hypothetical protein